MHPALIPHKRSHRVSLYAVKWAVRTMTIRNAPPELSAALSAEKYLRGLSLNRAVLALKEESLGVGGQVRNNGLQRLAGNWSEDEFREFENAVAPFGEIDGDLWG